MAPPTFEGDSLFEFVVRDGNGVKGLADSGIKAVPHQYVQPPEERIEKREGCWYDQPPIDLSGLDGPNHDQVAAAIVKAAETVGFFQVVNHGMSVELLEAVKESSHRFFAQPPEKKAAYKGTLGAAGPCVKYGTSFSPDNEKILEWKDYLSMVYTGDDDALKLWPNECKEVALKYITGSCNIVRKLLKVLFENLGETLDDARIERLIGYRTVNMNFYPVCPNPDITVGVGRHSDIGTLTVLLQDGIGGLYVNLKVDSDAGKKGEWIEIPPTPGALVINICDVIEVMSNGRYKSAEHRVRTTDKQARVSIPVFTNPELTEMVGPLPQAVERDGVARYREVSFQDYITNFLKNPHDGKKTLDFAKITS